MVTEMHKNAIKTSYIKNNLFHRFDGPSIIWNNIIGDFEYFVNGYKHRIEGPAVIWDDNDGGAYYVNGLKYEKDLFEIKYKPCVLKDGVLT